MKGLSNTFKSHFNYTIISNLKKEIKNQLSYYNIVADLYIGWNALLEKFIFTKYSILTWIVLVYINIDIKSHYNRMIVKLSTMILIVYIILD